MRVRTAAPIALAVLVAVGPVAHAAPKKKPKPITKTFAVTAAPNPNPPMGPSCSMMTEGVNGHAETIKVTGPGVLSAKVSGFVGDWDTGVYVNGGNVAMGSGNDSGNTDTAPMETLKYKVKKAGTVELRVCNFAGSPQATGTFTFTYN
jgi:hypothetical protein